MPSSEPGTLPAAAHAAPAGAEPDLRVPRATSAAQAQDDLAGFELYLEPKTPTILRRFFATHRHFLGLLFGGLRVWVRDRPRTVPGGARIFFARMAAALGSPFVDEKLRDLPFPVQLRRRLEILGPTYIKLGQILSLREDILPK